MTKPFTSLETFDNPNPDRDYTISIKTREFTCLCPLSGQPDFAEIRLKYIPDKLCVELKSFKNYLWLYRERKAFHEAVSNTILEDLWTLLSPRFICLKCRFNVRGGLYTTVVVEQRAPGWKPRPLESSLSSLSEGRGIS